MPISCPGRRQPGGDSSKCIRARGSEVNIFAGRTVSYIFVRRASGIADAAHLEASPHLEMPGAGRKQYGDDECSKVRMKQRKSGVNGLYRCGSSAIGQLA
jgi:hypothetical protein